MSRLGTDVVILASIQQRTNATEGNHVGKTTNGSATTIQENWRDQSCIY